MSPDDGGPALDDLARLTVERACENLIYEYARRVDFGEAATIADLFTEDGRWEGTDLLLEGREQIREWFGRRGELGRRVSRHVCTNVAIEPVSPTEATGLAYMINYRHDRAEGDDSLPVPVEVPKWVGELQDAFRLTAEGWRFAGRRVTVGFERRRAPRDSAP